MEAGMPADRKLFLNLPVQDVQRTRAFFDALGFSFDPRFSDDTAIAMIIGQGAYAMLMTRERFAGFARRPVADPAQQTAGLYAISVESRQAVDDAVATALANGGAPAADPEDHGWMYGHSFYDPDGHHWEVFWMDMAAAEAAMGAQGRDATA
jgi:uncharacterized protein